jgi:S-adenosylmethionine:tRNA ribosyltransferase-isomerase
MVVPEGRLRFELPEALAAHEPPEMRGLARDGVRLMAVDRGNGAVSHSRFRQLPALLRRGDCLVFNASRTLPASLSATVASLAVTKDSPAWGLSLQLRLARRLDARTFSALLLDAEENPFSGDASGLALRLGPGGTAAAGSVGTQSLSAEVLGPDPYNPRLWRIRFDRQGAPLMEGLSRLGQPVRYWYSARPWDLDFYQTVYAREPGSMEMPSAGRAFTWRMLLELRRRGVECAFLVLHAGLSSYMDAEFDATHPASEEPYRIGPEAAAKVNKARAAGARVIAVGTTVVRALESAVDGAGRVQPRETSTRLRITRAHALRAVDGLITGFHEPEASHLDLLTAFLSEEKLRSAYAEALREKYLWHEFGDINLIL